MNNKQYKIKYRLFFVHMYKEEEAWLEYMSSRGWHLVSVFLGIRFTFAKGEPKDYKYSLDFRKNDIIDSDYIQLFEDAGWEYIGRYLWWRYFRAPKDIDTIDMFSDHTDIIERNNHLIFLMTIMLYFYGAYFLVHFVSMLFGHFRLNFVSLLSIGMTVLLFNIKKNLIEMNKELE